MRGLRTRTVFGTMAILMMASAATVHAKTNSSGISSTVTRHGIRVEVVLDRRHFPRDALVLAHVFVRNISKRPRSIETTCVGGVGGYLPVTVYVLNAHDRVLFPPALPGQQGMACPPYALRTLPPGQTISRAQYLVLRGRWIQARVNLPARSGMPKRVIAQLFVTLGASDPPELHVKSAPSLGVDVRSVASGPLMYTQWAHCSFGAGQGGSLEEEGWQRTPLRHIAAVCVNAVAWQVLVGQVDHSVAGVVRTDLKAHISHFQP